jgi:hypothetical protein
LSYRLNQREYFEEKFEIDYKSTNLDFYYLKDNFDNFVSEYSEDEVVVYYFDEDNKMQFLPKSSYEVDNISHKVTLENDGNVIVTPNNIMVFYVGFSPAINDERFNAYEFTYNPSLGMNDTLELTYWSVSNGEKFDVIPNLNAYNYMNEPKTTFTNFVSHATQVAAFLEEEESLVFDLAGELSWYNEDLLEGIQNGEYLSIYLHASFENYQCLDHITVKLHNSSGILSEYTQNITVEELVMWDFDVKINLPSEQNNDLQTITITPIFSDSDEYSEDNILGIPHFELLEWDDDLVEGDANRYVPIQLKTALVTDSTSLDIAYLFNDELQYLSLPEGIEFNWSFEDNFLGDDHYTLYIPEVFVDPSDTSKNATFEDGDLILIRYNKPSQKLLKIGIKEIYFNKKPYNFDSLPIISEFMLINASDSSSYEEFIAPYNCNLSLPLTPFDDEFTSSYKNVVFDLNVSDLEAYAIDGYVEFSHLLFSAPNPNYELTVSQVVVIRETEGLSDFVEFFNSRVWQFTEFETLVSSSVPENDSYHLELTTTPLFYNDADQGKWLEYLKIYDENYNYFSAGISGDEYQLLWSPTTQNFTWNPSFNRFQEYWGMEIELPHVVQPNTTLYFEYCTNTSWSNALDFEYQNANSGSFELIYNYDYLLTPRFEEWYGELIENTDYDYETEQFYSESFVVYTEIDEYTYTFELEYDLDQDFLNLSLFRIVGLYANFSEKFIDDDNANYSLNFEVSAKTITITDLNSTDGLLNEFDAITVVLNFTHGPVSTKTKLYLSDSFNQTYLGDNLEDSFYDYLSGSFVSSVMMGDYLFVERAETIASDYTSFTSIDYTRNSELSSNNALEGYNSSALFDNFELYLDPYNVIYEADSDMDGKKDFKHEIDVDKNGKVDVIRFGVESEVDSSEIVWHTVINDFLGDEALYDLKSRPKETTQWFDVDDAQFATSLSLSTIVFAELDYWAKKSVEQTYATDYSVQSSFYSIMVDEDYDGNADIQYTYEKTDTVQYTSVTNNETTILAAKPQNALTYIYCSMAEWIGSLISGGRVDPIFNEKLTPEMVESGSYPSSYHWLATDIRETLTQTYKKYSIITTKHYVDNQISEQITVNSWANGTLIESRVYKDLFKDETIDLGIDLSQIITNLETGQQKEVPLDFMPAVQTEESSYDRWDDGSDVPSKYESLTIVNSETSSSENINLFEREIKIVIPSRINPYRDYKKVVSIKTSSTSDMKLNITGVFITPADGKVYYTSDKDSFKINGGKTAKTRGHYLYYDSDQNGFFETVYVLSPVKGYGDDAYYEVIAIGFNYDGKHDFIPYSKTETGFSIESLNEFKDVLSREIHLTDNNVFTFAKLKGCDRLFPPEEHDGYELKDNVFEIRKLISTSAQNTKFSELFYETRHKEFDKVWEIFGERYERDLNEQVTISIIAGVAAAIARYFLIDFGAMAVYFGIYTTLSLITNDVKAREAEAKLRSQTFYSEDADNNQPRILNSKYPTDDIWSDSMAAALSGHPGTYYAEVRGGQTGNEYLGYVVAAPPSDARCWGGSNTGLFEFIGSNLGSVFLDYLPQDVNPDIMAGLDFDYHNLDFLMVSSELYSYNDQKHYTYFEGSSLAEKMLELEPIYEDNEKYDEFETYYITGPEMVLRIIQNYDSYKLRQNTLGYLQREITERTGGNLTSIKWICSDATPQYLFAQEDSTAPLSTLFSPLIVSSQRYDQLSDSRKFGYMFVDIASPDASNTKGIDSTDLLDLEKEFYCAKIPLADLYGAFNYPIESVTLHKVVNKEVTSKTLSASDYEVPEELQNLYFTRPVDELMEDSASDYNDGAEVYYVCEIKFSKIIPDDGNLSEDDWRNLLAQATMYPILDYFDQHVFAATTAKMIGEIAYTEILTLQSTIRSATVVALAGATISIVHTLAKGSAEASSQIGASLLATLAVKVATKVAVKCVKIAAQTIGEMFEEIVLDGFVEAFFENSARMLGWTPGVGQLISTLMTTVRETKMFGLFNLGGQSVDTQTEQKLTTKISQLIAERDSSQSFTEEKFLRENQEEVRSIMAELGLVPSRHETILKMAGIVGSGVFAGLSLLIPGLSFAGFSLYGFNPMIKHLGQKVLGPKAGTTTMMRAAIKNARQDMISKYAAVNIELEGVKKGLGQSTELGNDGRAATVESINQISSSGQAVEYLVDSKLVVLAPISLEDVSMFGAFSAQTYYTTELEESINNLEEIQDNKRELKKISESFLKKTEGIVAGGFIDIIRVSLEGLPESITAELTQDGMNWRDKIGTGVSLHIPNFDMSFTIQNIIDIAKLRLGLGEDIELRFWSPDTGIVMMKGESITSNNVLDGEIDKITPESLYSDISSLFGLTLVVIKSEDKSFLNEPEFKDVREFLSLVDHTTRGNMEFSIRNRADALTIKAFLENIFNPLANIFANEFDLGIDDYRSVIEYGLENLFINNFLSEENLKKIDPAYHQLYGDFVNSLFKFKFKDILDNTIAMNPRIVEHKIKQATFLTMFDYLAQQKHLDLKSLTIPEFINTLSKFTDKYSVKSSFSILLGDITQESMNINFFLKLSEFFMTTDSNPVTGEEIMGVITGAHTFHGWTLESVYMFSKYVDRVINVLKESGFDIIGLYQWSERNPQYYDREKAREFNIDLLQSQLKEINNLINNNIDTTKYLNLPTNSREFDILVLLVLGIIPTFYSSHLKSIRSDLINSDTVIRDKKYGLSRDSLGHILEASKYWFTTIYYEAGDIQGPRQVSNLVCATLESEVNSKEVVKFMFDYLQDSDNLYEKGQLDSQVYHKVAKILNKYIKDQTFTSLSDVSDELSWLFSSFTSDISILDQNYASIIEQEIKEEVLKIYRRTHDIDKVEFILNNWDSIYNGIKKLFTQETDNLLRELPEDHYELVWEDKIVHSFLRFDENENKVLLKGSMLLSDSNFIGIIDLSRADNLRDPTSSETFNVPMIVVREKSNTERWGLIRSDEIRLLPRDYKFTDIILNTKEGYILDSQYKLDMTLEDLGSNWYLSQSYFENPLYFIEQDSIFTLRNCYRYIMYFAGENVIPFLQEFKYNFVPVMAHEQYFVKEIKKASNLKSLGKFELPIFKSFSDLDKDIQNELTEILSILDQIKSTFLPNKDESFKFDAISDLIISENFFDEDLSVITSIFNDMNPTQGQLSDLSFSRQKLFYYTFHELLKSYTGISDLVADYKLLYEGLTFQNIHSEEYTKDEFEAVKTLEQILPKIFGYRFHTLLKLGMISMVKEGSTIKIQPISLHLSLLRDIMNGRRIKSINFKVLGLYKYKEFYSRGLKTLASILVFGQATFINIIGEVNPQVIYTKANKDFISDLIGSHFKAPTNPARYFVHYGSLLQSFLEKYANIKISDFSIRKNIIGKSAIMDGFANLLPSIMSSGIIELAGRDLNIDAFKDNSETWSKKNINYAFAQIFEKLIIPAARSGSTVDIRDVTDTLLQIFTGKKQVATHKITSGNIRGNTRTFWQSDNYGKVTLDYATLSQFFGKDFHKIQPSLYYTYYNLENHPQALSIEGLFTKKFMDKADHLYNNYYKILSSEYKDGVKLTARFHKEDSQGLHKGTTLKSILRGEFTSLLKGTSLSYTVSKQGNIITNLEELHRFIVNIVFYQIFFNSIVFIQDGSNYGLFTSQREIFGDGYITGVSAHSQRLSTSVVLSAKGLSILEKWSNKWNREENKNDGRIIWDFGDCWPVYLFEDALRLIETFNNHFYRGRFTDLSDVIDNLG